MEEYGFALGAMQTPCLQPGLCLCLLECWYHLCHVLRGCKMNGRGGYSDSFYRVFLSRVTCSLLVTVASVLRGPGMSASMDDEVTTP